MRIRILLLSVGLFLCTYISVFSQCDEEYTNPKVIADTTYKVNFKNYVGYIFPENYIGYMLEDETKSFRLTLEQIYLIEEILESQYSQVYNNDSRVSDDYKNKNSIKSYLKKFDRQYLGYKNLDGEESAKVILARRKGKGKRYFECFDKIMVAGFGKFYERNQRYLIVNLEKKILLLP
ncbi:MAG: hypothetical protein ACQETL_04870 [Bacteroidota bacterium]